VDHHPTAGPFRRRTASVTLKSQLISKKNPDLAQKNRSVPMLAVIANVSAG
jgi:hypothetical protein